MNLIQQVGHHHYVLEVVEFEEEGEVPGNVQKQYVLPQVVSPSSRFKEMSYKL
jgi:hypothetical protein